MGKSLVSNASDKKRVVLIDDDDGVLFALKLLCETIDLEVTDFSDPALAVKHLSKLPVHDLIICDLNMPVLNGLEVLRISRELFPTIPFVVMSGHATSKDKDMVMNSGGNGMLLKPFSPCDLKILLQDLESCHANKSEAA